MVAGLVLVLIALYRSLSIYLSALWFGSLGYSSVYWYIFKLKLALFAVFTLVTIAILRGLFLLLERVFAANTIERRTIVINNQPVEFSPARFVRPVSWLLAVLFGLFYGLEMKSQLNPSLVAWTVDGHRPGIGNSSPDEPCHFRPASDAQAAAARSASIDRARSTSARVRRCREAGTRH